MTRHFWVLIHRYAGLYIAFFLIVAGLTGSILAFSPELNNWLNPPLKIELREQPRLDEFALHEKAQALFPQSRVNLLNFNRKSDEAYTAYLEPRIDPATGQPFQLDYDMVSLDPYTGNQLSLDYRRVRDLWPITRKNFIPLIVNLHYRLVLPDSIGVWLFGIAALLWTIDCFVSVYLTFPISRSSVNPSNKLSFISRWKKSWLIKWHGSAFRINFDLHRAGGLWVWLMLLVLAWSSVGFNLNEQVYVPVMKTLFNMTDPMALTPKLDKPIPDPNVSWREAQKLGSVAMAQQAGLNDFKVIKEDSMQYIAEYGAYVYIVNSDRDLNPEIATTWLVLDGATGNYLGLNLPRGQNLGNTINSWIFALHMATIWGLPYKIFLSLIGLVIVMLSVTGVYIWLKKRKARQYETLRKQLI